MSPHPFPRLRWAVAACLAVYVPTYAVFYGFANFLFLCNLAVLLTCVGLWPGSRLLVSSPAVAIDPRRPGVGARPRARGS